MADLKKLYEFWEVTKLVIDRSGTNGALAIELTFSSTNDELITLKFDRPNDIDNTPELIDIEHVLVWEEKGSQRDFGTIKVEFENLGEGWYEFWCDSVNEVN